MVSTLLHLAGLWKYFVIHNKDRLPKREFINSLKSLSASNILWNIILFYTIKTLLNMALSLKIFRTYKIVASLCVYLWGILLNLYNRSNLFYDKYLPS